MAFSPLTWLLQPLGRKGYMLAVPVLVLLGWLAIIWILATALGYPGTVPENIGWVYFGQSLIFIVPALLIHYKRLRSIGLPWLLALLLPLVVAFVIVGFLIAIWVVPTLIWVVLLSTLPPAYFPRKPR